MATATAEKAKGRKRAPKLDEEKLAKSAGNGFEFGDKPVKKSKTEKRVEAKAEPEPEPKELKEAKGQKDEVMPGIKSARLLAEFGEIGDVAKGRNLADVEYVKVGSLHPDEDDPLYNPDATPEDLKDLLYSVAARGIEVPLLTSKSGVIKDGRRRWQVAQLLHLEEVPRVIHEGKNSAATSITVNLARAANDPVGLAKTIKRIMDEDQAMTAQKVGQMFGRTKQWVWQALQVLELPAAVRRKVEDGKIAPTVALAQHRQDKRGPKGPTTAERRMAGENVPGRRPHRERIPKSDLPDGVEAFVTQERIEITIGFDIEGEVGDKNKIVERAAKLIGAVNDARLTAAVNILRSQVLEPKSKE